VDGCTYDESRGLFVRQDGRDGAAGTRDDPLRSIEEAASRAGGLAVLVCAEVFSGPVALPAGVHVVGGLACAEPGWPVAAGARTRVEAPPDEVPVRIGRGEGQATLDRLEIVAAAAEDEGGSSIALHARSDALLRDCVVEAGAGADGEDGVEGAASDPAAPGGAGDDACTLGAGPGEGGPSDCAPGGDGGVGGVTDGPPSAGAPGSGPRGGAGGEAEPATGRWSCASGDGGDGEDGLPGVPGSGATSLGTFEGGAFVPANGGAGAPGSPGGGGGGAGATRGATGCVGANGGGGGAGGCGGFGGRPGRGAGGSFAIVAEARLTIEGGRLVVGEGGAGGAGAPGGPGAEGAPGGPGGAGDPAVGVTAACHGGDGGAGGVGGPSGGGRGGHAVAVLFTGPAPELDRDVAIVRPEAGGPGGARAPGGEAGQPGVAADALGLE
jgi:hypothetical protein